MTEPTEPSPAIWTHCNIHPLAPSHECARCHTSIDMNKRQLASLRLTTDAQLASLLRPAGPLSPAELNVVLLGWADAEAGNVAAVIVAAMKARQ